ncbi:beta-lactamase [Hyphomicrobium denitrificans 1NES1]|uniref:Beta-lactamase n=1 Tax=Hyphomicrobium denitrificans 1NES1 TaxID=670307 RepID=N0B570_9HYPH|nr:quinoprotein relay system zinc metallohydrolase 1 [Hyphomicrobium denitrificans]AGK58669.1 beta-lactamase [Hyphomicrobium denitrificans 1NES1]
MKPILTRRQSLLLGASALSLFCCCPPGRAEPHHYDLKPRKLTDGVWVTRGSDEAINERNGGAIANVAILDSKEGAILIDTGPSRRFGEALMALAKELTGKPVVRVYLTHFHPDHMFGNQAFDPATLAATQGTIDGMKEYGNAFSDSMYRAAGDWMRGTELVLPKSVVNSEPEDFGGRRLRPIAMRGHTPSDLALFDEKTGILFAGDLVFLDRAPTTPHADIERWRISLANISAIPNAMIVPGHGPAESGSRGTTQTSQWLEAIASIIGDAFDRGLDISEAMALPLPDWTESIALARYEYERSVMHLYPQLEASRWPRIDER